MSPAQFELRARSVFVAGHTGMVGSALLRRLATEDCRILTATRGELDLRCQAEVSRWMHELRPDAVFVAAATVGGILANARRPAGFIYDNLMIQTNLVHAARQAGVGKLLLLGSSCIYPRDAPQPIREEALLSGPLEPTNEAYAVAKIAGLKLCQAYRRQYGCDFITAMPTNVYGPGDNFDLCEGHVLAALMRKAHEAKQNGAAEMEVWGTGRPRREFIHADDLADALVHLMRHHSGESPVNVGTGVELSVRELAEHICRVVGYRGQLRFDDTKPDGTPRKRLDLSRLEALGWAPRVPLPEGLAHTYAWLVRNLHTARL